MLNNIKNKVNKKHLLVLLIIPIIFIYSATKAESDRLKIYSLEELEEYVVYRASLEDYNYEFSFAPDREMEDFTNISSPKDPIFCERIIKALSNYEEILGYASDCYQDGSMFNDSYRVDIVITNSLGNKDQKEKLDNFLDSKIQEIILTEKTQAKTILKIRDLVDSMVRYNKTEFIDFAHPVLDFIEPSATSFTYHLDQYNWALILGYSISKLDVEYRMIESLPTDATQISDSYWVMVELDNEWFHLHPNPLEKGLVSDSVRGKYGDDWDEKQEAPSNYNLSNDKTTVATKLEKQEEERPKITYLEEGDYYKEKLTKLSSVGSTSWATMTVDKAIENSLVPENLASNYQDDITREEFSALIVRLIEAKLGYSIKLNSENPFEDTNNIDVLKSYEMGIVNGVSKTEFAPENKITRQDIAVMFDRTLSALNINAITNDDSITFADQVEIAVYAEDAVEKLNKLGILNGVGDNRINPRGNATREQAIMLSYRLYELSK